MKRQGDSSYDYTEERGKELFHERNYQKKQNANALSESPKNPITDIIPNFKIFEYDNE